MSLLQQLVAAIDDNTIPKSRIVGAVEVVAEKAPNMLDRLKNLIGRAAEKAGEAAVQRAIEYVILSGSNG